MFQKKFGRRSLSSPRAQKLLLVSLVGASVLFSYAGVFVYAMAEYNSIALTQVPPDPATFVPINSSRLWAMAMWFEDNIHRFHRPHDMIVNTVFNTTSGGVPVSYTVSYDSAEWTGHYLLAEACRYAVHVRDGNASLATMALGNITKVLDGFDKIIHVAPNGGMARYAWKLADYPYSLAKLGQGHQRAHHRGGFWNGTEHVYEDDTSRDMHNGVIMGLGMAYLLVDDALTRQRIQGLVEDLLENLMKRGWLYLTPDDVPNGTDLDAGFWAVGTPGVWTLAYLKVGALVNASKYQPLYREYALERDYVHRIYNPQAAQYSLVQSYYGQLLDWEVVFTLVMLETDPALRAIYVNYLGVMWSQTKNDRTPIFNAMWLALNGINRFSAPPDSHVIGDIGDCLMRYYGAPQRLPGRDVPVAIPVEESPIARKWVDFFTGGAGAVLYPYWEGVFQFQVVASTALTPDKRSMTDFLWSRSPYLHDTGGHYPYHEGSGVDFTVVYWLCRYHEILAPPADFQAGIVVQYPGGA